MKPPAPVTRTRGRCPLVKVMPPPKLERLRKRAAQHSSKRVRTRQQENEDGNVFGVAPREAAWLHEEAEQPFEAARLHPGGCLAQGAGMEVEGCSNTHDWHGQLRTMPIGPLLLARATQSDKDDPSARVADGADFGVIFIGGQCSKRW